MTRRLLVRIDGHLIEARRDQLEALRRLPLVQVDVLAGHPVGHTVPEPVCQCVGDGVAVDVDGVDTGRAVQPELDGEDAAATADVEAGLPVSDAGAEEMFPEEIAPLSWNEDARVDHELRERQGEQRSPLLVEPGARWALGHHARQIRGHGRARSPARGDGPASCR